MVKDPKNLRALGGEKKTENAQPAAQKATYEQLAAALQNAGAEVRRLRTLTENMEKQLASYQMNDFYTRVEWLWRIVTWDSSKAPCPFTDEFVAARKKEFEEMMTPIEPETEPKEEPVKE